MNSKKFNAALASMFVIASLAIYTIGCADDPSSLGLNFIPPGETTGVRIFDSFIDTLPITSENRIYYVNTSGSTNLMVGKTGAYESKGLLKFTNLIDTFDNSTVVSATLKMSYKNYYFPSTMADSLAQISFDVNKIEQSLDFSTMTYDSVNSSTFGTTSQGNYTGIPTADSQEVTISLNTTMVNDWLKVAADTSYSVKNYGIVLTPNNSSAAIKGFYAAATGVDDKDRPELEIIVTKNGVTDTFSTISNGTISLSKTDFTPSSETFNLQAGVSYVQVMKFDLSRMPQTATINDVQIFFSIDSLNSVISGQTTKAIYSQYINDSAGLKTDITTFEGGPSGSGQYMMRMVRAGVSSPFQRWLLGQTNYGLMLFAGGQALNLDRYVLYKETASDPAKRPRVIIKYTPRVIP
ncbi:MAG: DNRLRE domain-containing protein [Ignavibacteria bacterium]|nr:DNRLRE domain-containing protein [Ignavibacteria bacterium]